MSCTKASTGCVGCVEEKGGVRFLGDDIYRQPRIKSDVYLGEPRVVRALLPDGRGGAALVVVGWIFVFGYV